MSVISNGADLKQLLEKLHTDVGSVESTLSNLTSHVRERASDFACPDGISLLTLKNHVLLDYIHHLLLLSACKVSGKSLSDEKPSALVRNLVKLRLVLEKVRPMENRLKYQIEKLLRAADDADHDAALGRKPIQTQDDEKGEEGQETEVEEEEEEEEEEHNLLAFRPNPNAFMDDKARPDASAPSRSSQRKQASGQDSDDGAASIAVYRPPKLAPVAYDPDAPSRRGGKPKDRASSSSVPTRNSALLADISAGLSSNPYEMSSGGVGVGGRVTAQNSSRARALQRMDEYEEDNFTRLVMSKRDAKRRRRDEADVALGGAGLSSGRDGQRRIGGGVEEEFGDLLRTTTGNSKNARRTQQTYDSLRSISRTPASIQRARNSLSNSNSNSAPSLSGRKTNRFKKQMRRAN